MKFKLNKTEIFGHIKIREILDARLHEVEDWSEVGLEIKDELLSCDSLWELLDIVSEWTEETPKVTVGDDYVWLNYSDYAFGYDLSKFEVSFTVEN